MQRSIINSAVVRCARPAFRQTARRGFASTTTKSSSRSLSRWVVPTSIMAIGISSYYLSQAPLKLDTKKDVKDAKPKSEPKEVKSTEESKPVDGKAPESGEQSQEGEIEGEEGKPQSAYNPETGEINWDCPCLGGMANGPCGEEFKEAFSCFVFSEADPKGFDCIEKFKNMQNCFRKYPDVYSEEIRDEENAPVDTTASAEEPASLESQSVASQVAVESIPSADVNPVVTEQVPVAKEN